jgi:SH3-like domain-containing protein
LVSAQLNGILPEDNSTGILKYVSVTAPELNVRNEPKVTGEKIEDRVPVVLGSILRVYQEQNGWCKISSSAEHWVSSKFTAPVLRATVNADTLNVRNGPSVSFSAVGAYTKGQELFIIKEDNNWCRVSMDDKWVSKEFLNFG